MPNLYSILRLDRRANSEEIKAACRALAKRSHPDVNAVNKEAERRTKQINRGCETLGDPEARAAYDLALQRKRAKARRRVRDAMATMAATCILTVGCGLYFWQGNSAAGRQLAGHHEPIELTKNDNLTVSDPVQLREVHEAQAHVRPASARLKLAGPLSSEASQDPHAPLEQPSPRNDAWPPREPAKIRVLSASAMKSVLTDLAQAFRLESGHSVEFTFATAGQVEKRVIAGEATDIVIGTDVATEEMVGQGLVVRDTRTNIARVGVGIGVRQGATKPDISSAEAFKQALLAAKSVIYPDPARGGASGIHFAQVIENLGISLAIKQKAVLAANPDIVCESVAKGDVELCVHQISEILLVKGVALVGPLPPDVQRITTFAAALSARSNAAEAAAEFLSFLARPSFKAKFAEAGFDYPAVVADAQDRMVVGREIASQRELFAAPAGADAAPVKVKGLASHADPQEAERFVARGEHSLAAGNVAVAREFFLRAADAGVARGALMLASTYDPYELAGLHVVGVQPNIALAQRWYRRAEALGEKLASERIARLEHR
jgi:molybdate transport system substrate-binding protein